MKTPFIFATIIFVLALSSCDKIREVREAMTSQKSEDSTASVNPADFTCDTIERRFSIEYPKYMSHTTDLNAEASFQCSNILKETYSIVIDEDKNTFREVFEKENLYKDTLSLLENFEEAVIEKYSELRADIITKDVRHTTINGMDAIIVEMEADVTVESAKIRAEYLFGFIEGKSNVYQVWGWTKSPGMDKYRADFNYFINSLKEL